MTYSYQKDRDETIALLTAEGMPIATIRRLFSLSQTLHRLAVASCNGDWPADNGDRIVVACSQCDGLWVPSSFKRPPNQTKRVCPDCYTTAQIQATVPAAFHPIFNGDPRGCVLKIAVPSGKTNDGNREGICIPVRDR